MAKKTNIHPNSYASNNILKANGTYSTQENRLFSRMSESQKAHTRRELMKIAALESGAACRTIYNLLYKKGKIKVSHTDKCKTTGRTVNYYVVNGPNPA